MYFGQKAHPKVLGIGTADHSWPTNTPFHSYPQHDTHAARDKTTESSESEDFVNSVGAGGKTKSNDCNKSTRSHLKM